MSSRFLWRSLLRWGVALVFATILIIQMVFPSSFGIPPSFRLWKLALNGVLLIGWIVSSRYFWKANSPFSFALQPVSFRQALLLNVAGFIAITLFFLMEALTNGLPLDVAIRVGLSVGVLYSIVPMSKTFLYWHRRRRAK